MLWYKFKGSVVVLLITLLAIGSISVQAIQSKRVDMENTTMTHVSSGRNSHRRMVIKGPVDIEVYNASDKLVGAIVDDSPQQSSGNILIFSRSSEGEQLVSLSPKENYRVELLGIDVGMLSVTIEEYTDYIGPTRNRIIGYYDLPVEIGETFTTNIMAYNRADLSDGAGEGSETVYKLLNADGSEVEETVSLIGSEARAAYYRVDVYTEDGEKGLAFGWGNRSMGRYIEVVAGPTRGHEFEGWYAGNEKLSEEVQYQHRVEGDIEITARFRATSVSSDSVSDNSVDDRLLEKIKEVKEATAGETVYTSRTWRAFNEALQQAESLVAFSNYTTEEFVEAVIEGLTRAFEELEEHQAIDKADLLAKIKEADELVATEYTNATWEVLETSVEKARILSRQAESDISQQEVDVMQEELEQAIRELEISDVNTTDEIDVSPTDVAGSDESEEVKARDTNKVSSILIAILAVSTFSVIIVIAIQLMKRRNEQEDISWDEWKEYVAERKVKIIIGSVCIVACILVSMFLWVSPKTPETIGELAYDVNAKHGYTIYIKENKGYRPYLVLTKNYGGENHVLLLRDYLLDEQQPYYHDYSDSDSYDLHYGNSFIDTYLNTIYIETIENKTRNHIQTTAVDITLESTWEDMIGNTPVRKRIPRKVFLLSSLEVGSDWNGKVRKEEALKYFRDSPQNLIARQTSNADVAWMLRTEDVQQEYSNAGIDPKGNIIDSIFSLTFMGVRPAFCLDADMKIVESDEIVNGKTVYILELENQ